MIKIVFIGHYGSGIDTFTVDGTFRLLLRAAVMFVWCTRGNAECKCG